MSPPKKPRVKRTPPPPTPRQGKPWDRPPLPKKGDDDQNDTFRWVGRALTEWEEFEAYFGKIYGVFVGATEDADPALRSYGAVLTFRSRLAMVRAAAEAFFAQFKPHGASVIFKHLADKAEKYSARRNEIAHGMVQLYFPEGKSNGTVLVPARFATSRKTLIRKEGDLHSTITPDYAYASPELIHLTRDFYLLAQEASAFYHSIFWERRRLAPLPKASPQKPL